MKIGIAGPMSLELLKENLPEDIDLPLGYPFPMISVLINGLIERGYDVVAYTTSTDIKEPIEIYGKKLTLCIARREPNAARDLFYSERKDLIYLIQRNPVDLINAHWTYEFAWAAIDSGIPTLVTLHDHALTILRYQFDPFRFMRLIMNYWVLHKATYLSTNSMYIFHKLSKKNRLKARIIPNFYEKGLETLYSKNNKNSHYIITVSNGFGKIKNVENGLRAFKIIKQKAKDLEYHVIGTGMEYGGPAYTFAQNNGLDEGVKFHGQLPFEDVIQKISTSAILLHPSREESFGMAVLEAMISGTPVIGGIRSGNIPYLLNTGEIGVLCDINSPESIANAILAIYENDNLQKIIREKAFSHAQRIYSKDTIITTYIDYYNEIINKTKKTYASIQI